MRRLIINADDLGLTQGVNRGILDGWLQGVVTSTTAMAGSAAFDDAIALLAQALCPATISSDKPRDDMPAAQAIGVGCHIVLVDGTPVLPVEEISTLVDTRSGRFRPTFGAFASSALGGRLDDSQIEAEATAQIRKLQQAGVNVTHVDTHKHVHMFPDVLRPVLRAARACGVVAVRNPFAPAKPLSYAQLRRHSLLWKRFAEVKLLRFFWHSEFRRAVAKAQLLTTDGTFGIVVTGEIDEALLQAIVEGMPDGTWELCCHPGYNDLELERAGTRLVVSRKRELELMTSGFARDLLAREEVELITYRDLRRAD